MTTERELVRIIKEDKVVDVYHGGFNAFSVEGYKQYERPFTAEYCIIEVTDTAVYSNTVANDRRN